MKQKLLNITTSFILTLSTSLWLFGRAWQHLFWETPYREFLWNGKLMAKPIKWLFNLSWNDYMTNPTSDLVIEWISYSLGIIFLLTSIIVWLPKRIKLINVSLITSLLLQIPYVWLHFLGYAFNTLQLFEFALQIGAPIALLLTLNRKLSIKGLSKYLVIIIAATYTAHGLYAMNILPLPQSFIQMTITGFGVSNSVAKQILWYAGFIDVLLSIAIFFPRSINKWALLYAIAWGFATAFARIYCNVYSFDFWNSLSQWHFQFLVRNAHFMMPGLLLLIVTRVKK
ncbi:MAG: hypothetical protein ACJAUV_001871 [Flavobacteriales bacterium]|jgi:hypothetical protein